MKIITEAKIERPRAFCRSIEKGIFTCSVKCPHRRRSRGSGSCIFCSLFYEHTHSFHKGNRKRPIVCLQCKDQLAKSFETPVGSSEEFSDPDIHSRWMVENNVTPEQLKNIRKLRRQYK